MELRHLRYFVAVAESRNLSRAAASLHIAQPALSRQIHDLEKTLGVPLFVRHPKGVEPTMAGEALARLAPRMLSDVAGAIDRANATASGRLGRVVLGSARAFVARGFPVTVQEELGREHPGVSLVVHDIDPPDLEERLAEGAIDIALTVEDRTRAAIASVPLWRERMDHVLLPASHPLSRRSTISLPDLADLPGVISPRAFSGPLRERTVATLRAAGMRSPLLVADGGLQSAHLAVAVGRGWALVTGARAVAPPPGTVAVPLTGLDFSITAVLTWRRDDHRPVVRTVIEKVVDLARREPDTCIPPQDTPRAKPARSTAPPRHAPGTTPASLEFRHLRALLAVAATRTIGRAAEQLGVTQPSLSRQLKELEHAVGVRLLERSARGVRLTPAGTAFAEDCPALLRSAEGLAHEVRRARRGMEARCMIGAIPTGVTNRILTRVIADCATRHPHVRVAIVELPATRLPDALDRGDIDLGLAHAYLELRGNDHLALVHLEPDVIDAALVGRSHPLAARKKLSAADLSNEPFLFVDRSFYPPLFDRVMTALAAIGLHPRIEATYNGLHATWALVAQGKGWTVGFRSQVAEPPPGSVAIPLTGLEMPWGIDLVYRQEETNPAVLAVAELLTRPLAQSGRRKRRI